MDLKLPCDLPANLRAQLSRELVEPATEFMQRSSKQIRKQLVSGGFLWQRPGHHFSADEQQLIADLGDALELIHSASLIIDDIQDSSPTRRGGASVHMTIGTGKAINLGNWLYFKGFEKVDDLCTSPEITLSLLRFFRRALLKGHAGQALDLGTPISQCERSLIPEICEASIRLKTGALTGLAFAGGAILAGADYTGALRAFTVGEEIGFVLQSLDDLKNLKHDPLTPTKRFEDLKNERPGLVWSLAAGHDSPLCWTDLISAISRLPDDAAIDQWLGDYSILSEARRRIDTRILRLRHSLAELEPLQNVLNQLVKAYEDL